MAVPRRLLKRAFQASRFAASNQPVPERPDALDRNRLMPAPPKTSHRNAGAIRQDVTQARPDAGKDGLPHR